MRRPLFAAIVLALLAVACSGSGATTTTGIGAPAGGAGREGFAVSAPAPADAVAQAKAAGQPATANNGVPVPLAFEPDRMLILTASVAMRAKDPWSISERAQSIAIGLGGDVMGLSQSGSGDKRTANLTLRVPSARFNDAIRALRDINDVEIVSSNVDGKDVTESFVDLDARLRAKVSEEQRYLALLARADKIDDILKIDQSLSQVRTQIEQLTGQLNSLKQRTAFSTITVAITPLLEVVPPIAENKAYDPTKTIATAVAALTVLLRFIGDLAIWTLVFGWIPLVLFGVAMALQRTRRTTATPPTAV